MILRKKCVADASIERSLFYTSRRRRRRRQVSHFLGSTITVVVVETYGGHCNRHLSVCQKTCFF